MSPLEFLSSWLKYQWTTLSSRVWLGSGSAILSDTSTNQLITQTVVTSPNAFIRLLYIIGGVIGEMKNPPTAIPSGGCWICDGVHHVCRQRVKNTCQELGFLCPRTAWKIDHRHPSECVWAFKRSLYETHARVCQKNSSDTTKWNAGHHRWPSKCLGRDVMWSAAYSKDGGAGENKPKQVSRTCLFLPLIKCQSSPRLEEEEGTCQSCRRPLCGSDSKSTEDGTGFCVYGQRRLGAALGDSLETSRGTKSFLRGTWFYKILSERCLT